MRIVPLAVVLTLSMPFALAESSPPLDRIALQVDTSEADAVLAILQTRASGRAVTDDVWNALFTTLPYQRLKKREASLRRTFTDDEFKTFVTTLDARRSELARTVQAWKTADLHAAAERSLRYLPEEAKIRASVYPMIKPRPNSFVFETTSDPAIFLYVDPAVSPRQFGNTVAHELHHIGLASLSNAFEKRIESLPPNSRKVAEWMSAFGEGMAMLAAAGSPDVHPVADFPASDRQRWDEDMKYFSNELDQVNQFFLDVLGDSFKNLEAADHEAMTFFGYRGPWYLVGYRMAVAIEKEFGRAALIDTLRDPRLFVAKYNEAAKRQKLPMFSADVIKGVGL